MGLSSLGLLTKDIARICPPTSGGLEGFLNSLLENLPDQHIPPLHPEKNPALREAKQGQFEGIYRAQEKRMRPRSIARGEIEGVASL